MEHSSYYYYYYYLVSITLLRSIRNASLDPLGSLTCLLIEPSDRVFLNRCIYFILFFFLLSFTRLLLTLPLFSYLSIKLLDHLSFLLILLCFS